MSGSQNRSVAARMPEWSSDQTGMVRRMLRQGSSIEDIAAALGPPFTAGSTEKRARRLGMPLPSKRAHLGTSKLSIAPRDKRGHAADPI